MLSTLTLFPQPRLNHLPSPTQPIQPCSLASLHLLGRVNLVQQELESIIVKARQLGRGQWGGQWSRHLAPLFRGGVAVCAMALGCNGVSVVVRVEAWERGIRVAERGRRP